MHATVQLFQLFKASTSPSFQNQKYFLKSQKILYELQVPVIEKVSEAQSLAREKFSRRLNARYGATVPAL